MDQFTTLEKDQPYTVYCARGGMRSQVITSFMRYLGLNAHQMLGGYKNFRKWNLNYLNSFQIQKPIILHGQTGVGKTLVLDHLKNTIDLEGCAVHRGSLFGGIGKQPVNQKTFEANLLLSLEKLDNSSPVFLEGESRKVGDCSIPDHLFQQMKKGKVILLEAPLNLRVERTVEEYITRQPEQKDAIRRTIFLLKNDLGNANITRLIDLFDGGNFGECFEYILTHYYDKRYSHSMKKLSIDAVVSAIDIDTCCKEISSVAVKLYPTQ